MDTMRQDGDNARNPCYTPFMKAPKKPDIIDSARKDWVKRAYRAGWSVTELARMFNTHHSVVSRILKKSI